MRSIAGCASCSNSSGSRARKTLGRDALRWRAATGSARFAPEPRVLLLDEPLGSLDRPLRERLLEDLEALFRRLRVTALFVTHDQAEAFALGDRVAVMREGRVVQVGAPDELWAHPADTDVARFLGLANVRDGNTSYGPRPSPCGTSEPATPATASSSLVRHGPTVRLTVRLDDGSELDAAVTSLEHRHRASASRSRSIPQASFACDPPPRRRPRLRPGCVLSRLRQETR